MYTHTLSWATNRASWACPHIWKECRPFSKFLHFLLVTQIPDTQKRFWEHLLKWSGSASYFHNWSTWSYEDSAPGPDIWITFAGIHVAVCGDHGAWSEPCAALRAPFQPVKYLEFPFSALLPSPQAALGLWQPLHLIT